MKLEVVACIIIAIITILLRALPFILENLFHKSSNNVFLDSLSEKLTPALIGMLVIYCLKDISFSDNSGLCALIAASMCIISYASTKNTLISIVFPTVLYMVLINTL